MEMVWSLPECMDLPENFDSMELSWNIYTLTTAQYNLYSMDFFQWLAENRYLGNTAMNKFSCRRNISAPYIN